ncbi:MAG: hypothetical protein GBAus27B_000290 [Mycoplasmataceae bacterium]|nr:MAG: hypothetical protein GBAus27B_000290 [Mycoplasmataceae bacterium]
MSELFNLVNKHFSDKDKEHQWTYACSFIFTFKKSIITEITITDHYQQNHPELTNELILNILKEKVHGRIRMKPRTKHDKRDIYVFENFLYQGKKYRLIFWFKDNSNSHLWIRNCYPID